MTPFIDTFKRMIEGASEECYASCCTISDVVSRKVIALDWALSYFPASGSAVEVVHLHVIVISRHRRCMHRRSYAAKLIHRCFKPRDLTM